MFVTDYTFLPDNALAVLANTDLCINALDFFEMDMSEMEENPLFKNKDDAFSINHELFP